MNFDLDFDFPDFSDPLYLELVEQYFDVDNLDDDSFEFVSEKNMNSNSQHSPFKNQKNMDNMNNFDQTLNFDNFPEEHSLHLHNQPLQQDEFMEDLGFGEIQNSHQPNIKETEKKEYSDLNEFFPFHQKVPSVQPQIQQQDIIINNSQEQNNFQSNYQQQHQPQQQINNNFYNRTSFSNRNFGTNLDLKPKIMDEMEIDDEDDDRNQYLNQIPIPNIELSISNRYKMQEQSNTKNNTFSTSVLPIFDIFKLEIGPSAKNRRGKNHLFTDSLTQQVPVIKKDKNVRFSITFLKNSIFAKPEYVYFVENLNFLKPNVLYLSRHAMYHRSGKTPEWVTIPNAKWKIINVAEPETSVNDFGKSCFFELRFPNSQRKMMIKTNKNIYKFALKCSMLLPNNRVKICFMNFIYKIDSNGKKKKEMVTMLRTQRNGDNFTYQAFQANGTNSNLKHSTIFHSYFSKTKDDGVFQPVSLY